jgi:hypothetical protein
MSVLKPRKTAGTAIGEDVNPYFVENALIATVGIPNALIASVQMGKKKRDGASDRRLHYRRGAQLFATATFFIAIVIPVAVVLVVYHLLNHLMEASSPLERARTKRR